jgi:hypothetical protein
VFKIQLISGLIRTFQSNERILSKIEIAVMLANKVLCSYREM